MCIYSYLFCLYWCKDYCHRVTSQLQLVIIIIIFKSGPITKPGGPHYTYINDISSFSGVVNYTFNAFKSRPEDGFK